MALAKVYITELQKKPPFQVAIVNLYPTQVQGFCVLEQDIIIWSEAEVNDAILGDALC